MANPADPYQSALVGERLRERHDQLRERIDRIGSDLRREQEPLTADAPDQAIQRENDDVLDSLRRSAQDELRQVDAAVGRLAAGTYGRCQQCGDPIDAQRLKAIPHALRCSACAASPDAATRG